MFPLFALMGGLFFTIGVKTAFAARHRKRHWAPSTGVVVDYKDVVTRRHRGTSLNRYLKVRHSAYGMAYEFWNRYGSNLVKQKEGDEVPILYNPENPEDAIVTGPIQGGGLFSLLFGGIGFIFMMIGLIGCAFLFWFRLR
ncbi:DUF3592 domain-containing protein [Paenibacillus sp. CC-CFT747]|nr:DUF3592 domain-containing protein [Paenibacillus sp. CC-CFT747]